MAFDIAKSSILKPVNTWLVIILLVIGGVIGLSSVGQLEDPAFTIKQVKVMTAYPGANAIEVEQEVTEHLETVIQQMSQLKRVTSISKPGMSDITVEVEDRFKGAELTQIWDELRKKLRDVHHEMPAGAKTPSVIDDFGDVYGLYYAVTAEGYSTEEIREFAKVIRRELLTVDGVAKVKVEGVQQQQVLARINPTKLHSLGLSFPDIKQAIEVAVRPFSDARITADGKKIRIPVETSANPVASLDSLTLPIPGQTAQLKLADIADIRLQEVDYPEYLVRYNGEEAVTIAVSVKTEKNVVKVGAHVEALLQAIFTKLPAGIEINAIYDQANIVDESISGFLLNLTLSVAVVFVTLLIFMGLRPGIVVGSILVITVVGGVMFMWLFGINMQRISLGAMVIAMGMLVDNAIVVAEGMMIRMQQGKSSLEAASYIVKRTKWPLLGATVIGIAAFSGIGLSQNATGEFLFSLFAVIAITLLLSWFLAITVAPLFGHYFFKKGSVAADDAYRAFGYRMYRGLLVRAVRYKWLSLSVLIGITVASYAGFGLVKQSFFPPSNTPIFYVHYWGEQGQDIHTTANLVKKAETRILQQDGVTSVSSFVGRGAERYTLTYNTESQNEAYALLMVQTENMEMIDSVIDELKGDLEALDLNASLYTDRIIFGPPTGAKLEARFLGADTTVLRGLAEQAEAIFYADGKIQDIRHNWRDRTPTYTPVFDDYTAGIAGISRADFSDALQFSTSGLQVGTLQVKENRYPIVLQADYDGSLTESEKLMNTQVWSQFDRHYVPLVQLTKEMKTDAEEGKIYRRDRVRSLSVLGEPAAHETANEALARIKAEVEAIPLPDGYRLEWGGEYQSTIEAQTSLGAALPLGFLVMFIISVLLFGTVREPLIIWLIVPMAVTGVVVGLLSTDMPFGFMSLLGFLSLFGMLIKNAIVLLEEIKLQNEERGDHYTALIEASISRLRPVLLAAVTTVLGMAPLLSDAFFAGMAVTIMGGLTFATVLTLIAVPVLYALLYRLKVA